LPESAWQGSAQRGVLQVAELTLRLPGWTRSRRVVAGRRLLGIIPAEKEGAFWGRTRHEFEAYVTDLDAQQASGWQIVELYRRRAYTQNVFYELKHPLGVRRLLQPQKERHRAGRSALLVAGRFTQSGRQKQFSISVAGAWWEQLKTSYQGFAAG
jgi:hypothetical protein